MKRNLMNAALMGMLLLSGSAMAELNCRIEASTFGPKSSVKRISDACIEEARGAAALNSELLDSSLDGSVAIFGHKNYIVIDLGKPKLSFVAGKMSGLKSILSLSVSDDGNQIAVLNKVSNSKSEILLFNTDLLGNVAPAGVINDEKLAEASQVSFSGDGSEIFILNPIDNQVSSINANGDSRARSAAKAIQVSQVYKSPKPVKQIQGSGSEIIILTDDNQLKAINRAGNSTWDVNLSDKGIVGANSFDLVGEDFEVVDGEGVKTMRHPASE